jgi:peptidoglycan/xylan/chitin deacetylase (PgdA/CDA1 family)
MVGPKDDERSVVVSESQKRPAEDVAAARELYLEDTVRVWLGVRANSGAEVQRLPERLARRLLREEEYEQAHRDQWGCWEYGFSESFREGTLLRPELDLWLAAERQRLTDARVPLEPLWPDRKPFAVCLTHDIDGVSLVSTPAQVVRSMRMSLERPAVTSAPQRVLRLARPPVRLMRAARSGIARSPGTGSTLERFLAIEREHGVSASYFFTALSTRASRHDCVYDFGDPCVFGGKRRRISDVIEQLVAEGFDVGLHGSYHSARTPGLLAEQKRALEDAAGVEVTTTRQHYLHWDVRTTPRLQSQAGLRADTTLGFNRGLGFRAGTSLPFRHFDLASGETLPLLEVPLIVQDGALFEASALELNVEMAEELVQRMIDTVAHGNGVATFVFHPIFAPAGFGSDGVRAVFRSAVEYASSRGAWFASLAQIERWWRKRAAGLAAT